MSPVAIVGSANMDLVVRTPRFPSPGETLLGGPFSIQAGGKGANASVAVARLGAHVNFIGSVGNDTYSELLLASLRKNGVDVTHSSNAPDPTGVALITVTEGGENTIVVAPGANARLEAEHVLVSLTSLQPNVILVSLEIPMDAVEACAAVPGLLIVNPAPAVALPENLWPRIDLFTPNASEIRFYTGIEPVDDAACRAAADRLFQRGVRCVLITLGERGAFLATPESKRRIPSFPVHAVDATGAGDSFNGALAAFLAEGRDLEDAAFLANRAAALACTKRGAQEAMPFRTELRDLGLEV